jgi:hypothetical protein
MKNIYCIFSLVYLYFKQYLARVSQTQPLLSKIKINWK